MTTYTIRHLDDPEIVEFSAEQARGAVATAGFAECPAPSKWQDGCGTTLGWYGRDGHATHALIDSDTHLYGHRVELLRIVPSTAV